MSGLRGLALTIRFADAPVAAIALGIAGIATSALNVVTKVA